MLVPGCPGRTGVTAAEALFRHRHLHHLKTLLKAGSCQRNAHRVSPLGPVHGGTCRDQDHLLEILQGGHLTIWLRQLHLQLAGQTRPEDLRAVSDLHSCPEVVPLVANRHRAGATLALPCGGVDHCGLRDDAIARAQLVPRHGQLEGGLPLQERKASEAGQHLVFYAAVLARLGLPGGQRSPKHQGASAQHGLPKGEVGRDLPGQGEARRRAAAHRQVGLVHRH
mmetsp:Transcript_30144/g.71818  ORF Transcript_30144/g.71818 Transcript_30144/m.71818 type:complete len:224 (+) Transcript_30144:3357-4028(+)